MPFSYRIGRIRHTGASFLFGAVEEILSELIGKKIAASLMRPEGLEVGPRQIVKNFNSKEDQLEL